MAKTNNRSKYRKSNGKGGKKQPDKKGKFIGDDASVHDPKEGVEKDEAYNKPEYYLRNPELAEQATQLSFQEFIGGPGYDDYAIPSIMRLFMNPSPGLTWQGSSVHYTHPSRSGINMAATKLFNRLSMKSGRNMAYAPQDVAICILQMSQLLAMHSYVKRLFRASRYWNSFNRMMPKALVEAMGIDYDDFVDNYSDYRTRYNALITTVNQLPILMNCGYLQKSADQYSFIFKDSDSPLSQIYLYLPDTTWIIDETLDPNGSVLVTTKVVPDTGTRTFGDLMANVLQPMVNALLTSSTLNLVYADMLNLAMKDPSFKFIALEYVVDGEITEPVLNYEALLHIHNMVVIGTPSAPSNATGATKNNDVWCDAANNAIKYQPAFKKIDYTTATGKVLNHMPVDSPVANPDRNTRLEMLRYKCCMSNNQVTIGGVDFLTYPALTDYYVTKLFVISNDVTTPVVGINSSLYFGTTFNTAYMAVMSQFDWHPFLIQYDPTWSNGSHAGKIKWVEGDLNYSTEVDEDYLQRLNEVIYLGLFDMG